MAGTTKLMTAGGGGVNLTPASSIASDVTVNVPSQNCTLGIQGPAFSAYQSSGQTLSSNTWTKLQFQTKIFDTNNAFDNVTNYRFQPTVAGYYQLNSNFYVLTTAATLNLSIYKNGVEYQRFSQTAVVAAVGGSNLVFLNGTTDYIEMYGFAAVGQSLVSGQIYTWFTGSMTRAA